MEIDEAVHYKHGGQLGFQEYFTEKGFSGISIDDFDKFILHHGTNVFGWRSFMELYIAKQSEEIAKRNENFSRLSSEIASRNEQISIRNENASKRNEESAKKIERWTVGVGWMTIIMTVATIIQLIK